VTLPNVHCIAQSGELGRVHQPRVIVLVTGEGQAEALDRPGDEQGGDVVLGRVERFDERFHAMAAEVGEQRRERLVVIVFDEGGILPELGFDALPPRRTALVMQRRELVVRKPLEPVLQRLVLRQHRRQLLAVAQLDHTPAAASEDLIEPLEHSIGARRIEALAIVVDDPPQVADVVLRALDDRFVDIALVELGITDQRDEAAAILLVQPAVRAQIILHQAGEERDRDAEPDGARREVDRDLVLGPARIGLRAAEAAEILQRLARLTAEQIMYGMKDRSAVRLHRDAIVGPERMEIERRHDRGHRRAARLMPADLQPVLVLADMVGMMNGPGRQPAQPLLERLQRFDVGGDGLQHPSALTRFVAAARYSGSRPRGDAPYVIG
jgi:hypothetical protein